MLVEVSSLAPLSMVFAVVGDDSVEVGTQLGLTSKARKSAVELQKYVLSGLFRGLLIM
jgi:hypothetical protein